MEIRNTPILVRVICFQSLLGVVYLWLNRLSTNFENHLDFLSASLLACRKTRCTAPEIHHSKDNCIRI